jgi:hypothetical protein
LAGQNIFFDSGSEADACFLAVLKNERKHFLSDKTRTLCMYFLRLFSNKIMCK